MPVLALTALGLLRRQARGPLGPHVVSRRGRTRGYADIRIIMIMIPSRLCEDALSIAFWPGGLPGRTTHNQRL